jgi:hypothetical protein
MIVREIRCDLCDGFGDGVTRSAAEARRRLRSDGWLRFSGIDLCDVCAKKFDVKTEPLVTDAIDAAQRRR